MSSLIENPPLRIPQGGYNVVIETPRGSRVKFAYDTETGLFRVKKLLAMGFAFPWPFGFFPSTRAEDGDPLDVLILTDLDFPVGSLVQCKLIGGIAVEEGGSKQREKRRNDRLLAVPLLRHQDRPPQAISDLPSAELNDLEDFLVAYQGADGKTVRIIRRLDKIEGGAVVEEAARRFDNH